MRGRQVVVVVVRQHALGFIFTRAAEKVLALESNGIAAKAI